MSAETEILLVLVGSDSDVIERIGAVSDQPMLVALHLAERKGRRRRKVLEAIESRGLQLEFAPVSVAAAHLQNEVVGAVARLAVSRPSALPLDRTLGPNDEYPTPADGDFEDAPTGRVFEYMRAPDLTEIGYEVLGDYADHLQPALDFSIEFMWKRKGGESGGNSVLGRCVKVGGLAGFYADHQFLIWVAADHARDFRLTRHQVEALLFHELKHVDRTETYAPTTRGHEVEMFVDEVRIFGPWKADLERMVRQLALPLEPRP